ncbi:hypothetical protein SCUP234_02735 [Seiridium cupressi]
MQQICSYPTVYACYETPQTLLAIGKGSAWSRHGPVFGSLQEDKLASSEPADEIGNDCIFTSGHVRIGDRHLVNTCKSGQPFSACPQENCWRKGIDACVPFGTAKAQGQPRNAPETAVATGF